MADRDSFLQMVRTALGIAAGHAVEPDDATGIFKDAATVESDASNARAGARADSSGLLDALAESAAEIGWQVRRCASTEDAAEAVREICRDAGVKTALRSRHSVFDRVPVDTTLSAGGVDLAIAAREDGLDADADAAARANLRADAFRVDLGITGIDYAIAETGTVVINPRRGVPRMVSLAPPRHIAIVERGDVLPSLDEFFILARADFLNGSHRGMMNLISGPSRTADIEGKIVTGIHGPLEAYLVIVG